MVLPSVACMCYGNNLCILSLSGTIVCIVQLYFVSDGHLPFCFQINFTTVEKVERKTLYESLNSIRLTKDDKVNKGLTSERFCLAALCHVFLAGDYSFVRQKLVIRVVEGVTEQFLLKRDDNDLCFPPSPFASCRLALTFACVCAVCILCCPVVMLLPYTGYINSQ